MCSPDRFLWCGRCAARRLLVFRCEFDDFDGNPTQFTPLNTSWWQSLVQVLRGCAELLQLLCGASTNNTILQSYFFNYCAELLILLLLLCRASSTTLVQSYYYYYCAELLRLLLCRASTSTLAQSARARCPQLFLADEGLPRQIKSN